MAFESHHGFAIEGFVNRNRWLSPMSMIIPWMQHMTKLRFFCSIDTNSISVVLWWSCSPWQWRLWYARSQCNSTSLFFSSWLHHLPRVDSMAPSCLRLIGDALIHSFSALSLVFLFAPSLGGSAFGTSLLPLFSKTYLCKSAFCLKELSL